MRLKRAENRGNVPKALLDSAVATRCNNTVQQRDSDLGRLQRLYRHRFQRPTGSAFPIGLLVFTHRADIEVLRLRVGEIKAAHAGCGHHGPALGQRHADVLRLQRGEHLPFHRVFRAGGITRRRANAPVLLGDQLGVAQRFFGRIGPELGAHALVHALGQSLGQAVRQRLEHDGGIVVEVGEEGFLLRFHPQPGGHGEHADVVRRHALGRDEVSQRAVGAGYAVHHRALGLLAQAMPHHQLAAAALVGIECDVVIVHTIGRP